MKDRKVIFFDGSIGTMLQSMGLPKGSPSELWNIEKADRVLKMHRGYVELGVDFITTNTFGGTPLKLSEYGLSCEDVNRLGVEIARMAVTDSDVKVAASVGPTGKMIEPLGLFSFEQAFNEFREQIKYLAEADILILETFSDIVELKAAVMAAKQSGIPFIPSMTFEGDMRTVSGTPPEVFAVTAAAFRPLAIGINCGASPSVFPEIVERLVKVTDLPVLSSPNAGIPRMEQGQTVFPDTPAQFAELQGMAIEKGAAMLGGCCGTTYEHIAELVKSGFIFREIKKTQPLFRAASRTQIFIAGGGRTRIIGERINPAGRKKLKAEIADDSLNLIRQYGIEQNRADALDVNVSTGKVDEYPILGRAARALSLKPGLPLFIDSGVEKALCDAFSQSPGRPVLNSISGKENDLNRLLPVAARWGAAFVGLPLDESGIPKEAEGRLEIAEKILKRAEGYGFKVSDILFDPLVLPIGSDRNAHMITSETLILFKENGLYTVAGVSNVSFGMPDRQAINRASLFDHISNGLDAAIYDPTDLLAMDVLEAGGLLKGQIDASEFLSLQSVIQRSESLEQDIVFGYDDSAKQRVVKLIRDGVKPLSIINDMLIPSIQYVGELYERREIFLPGIIASAEAVKACMVILLPLLDGKDSERGTIVLATVEGDIHDIGKNLVATLLTSNGYRVIDLGKDVGTQTILEAIGEYKPEFIGLSALMTTTLPSMADSVKAIREKFPEVKIIVGGATVDRDFAQEIGAHAYVKDAAEAARILDNLRAI